MTELAQNPTFEELGCGDWIEYWNRLRDLRPKSFPPTIQ